MALVTIRCPQTGGRVSTGIDTDAATFARLPDTPAELLCTECGAIHLWRKTDATLLDGGPSTHNKG